MDFKEYLKTARESTLRFIVPVVLLTQVQTVVVIFSLGIFAPVTTAGYIQSLLVLYLGLLSVGGTIPLAQPLAPLLMLAVYEKRLQNVKQPTIEQEPTSVFYEEQNTWGGRCR